MLICFSAISSVCLKVFELIILSIYLTYNDFLAEVLHVNGTQLNIN